MPDLLFTSPSPEGRATWTLVLASLGAVMTALDNMVVTTALPVLRADLHASLPALEWTVSAYVLAFGCLLLTGAALGDRFGRRKTYLVGIGLFAAASAGAALAPSAGALIVARVAQGAGAAIAFPLTLTLIGEAFGPGRRGWAIGLWGAIVGSSAAFGPLVGGAVVQGLDWHWIFWINVPIGLVVLALGPGRLSESFGPEARIDVPGVVLAGAGLLGLTWALVRSGVAGWASQEVLGALVAGLALLVAFAAWERRAAAPVLRLELFRKPGFAGANAAAFLMYGALFGALFWITQFLQLALGHDPLGAGLRMLPWTAAPMLIAPLAGSLADRHGTRALICGGFALQAIGFGWIAEVAAPGMGYTELAAGLGVAGLGISMLVPSVTNAALAAVPPEATGIASGTNTTLRQLGGVFGIALCATLFAHHGGYATPRAFTDGFVVAMWGAAALSAVGLGVAVIRPRKAGARAGEVAVESGVG